MFPGYNVTTRSPGSMGYFGGPSDPARRFTQTPYTADDYQAQVNQMPVSGRGNGSPSALQGALMGAGYGVGSPEMNSAFTGQGWAPPTNPATAAPGSGGAPGQQPGGSNPFQFNTGISPYQKAMSPLQSLYNAKPGSYPGVTPNVGQHQQLLRGLAAPLALGTEEQGRVMDAQHGLARDQARAQAGLGYGGLGLNLYGNQLQAQAPFDAFAANQMTLPINALSSLLRGLL